MFSFVCYKYYQTEFDSTWEKTETPAKLSFAII